jgi:hypothetical protein
MSDQQAGRTGHPVVVALLDEWQATRAALAEVERHQHPDIVDRYGRTWRWRGRGDLYAHCGSAIPKRWITHDVYGFAGLPGPHLADNHNYWQLCAICTSQWSDEGRALLKATREDFLAKYGPTGEVA